MNATLLNELVLLKDMPLMDLIAIADRVRRNHGGKKLDICSILNARSGMCAEDCKFCAQSVHYHTHVLVSCLESVENMVASAERAHAIGAERFGIVTSGNRLTKEELMRIGSAIALIKEKKEIAVCASLGALTYEDLLYLKAKGLSRYHHNIETSREFYPNVVSTHTFEERIHTIQAAKKAGLEVCSGGIVGMGETWNDRIQMACILKELEVDAIPLNILIPIQGTPFAHLPEMPLYDIIRTICIFRIILKDKIIKIAAGRETLKDAQTLAFMAGANGMLIGGYLTIQGRPVEADHALIKQIKMLWKE